MTSHNISLYSIPTIFRFLIHVSVGGGPLAVKITYSHHSFIEMAFSTDSQAPSHTTLTGLLFDIKITLVLLNEFIYVSGPVKKFSYHCIRFQGVGLSYGALTTSNSATANRFSQILTKKQEEYSIVSQPNKCLKFMIFREGCFVIHVEYKYLSEALETFYHHQFYKISVN